MKISALTPGKTKFLSLACLAISAGLLIAGLWPFQFRPANNVHWIDGQAGLRFDRYGIVYGQAPLFTPGGPLDFVKPFTIRLELLSHGEPSDYLPKILSVYDARGRELFILGQWKSALNLSILERQRAYYLEYQETEVGNFRKGAKQSILLSSGATGLTVYAEGKPVFTRPGFGFSLLSGNRDPAWLLLGNSPSGESPWRGDLLSLSFYAGALSPEEIATPGIDPLVHYLFSEGSGTVCRGGVDPRYDLFIPPVFRAPMKPVLAPPWKVQENDLSFWVDVAVNILGFIPFGFTLSAWRRKDGGRKRLPVMVLVVLAGAGISLLIELLQVYLPTRDSSLTDFMNNTLGTYIGAWLFRVWFRKDSRNSGG
jgi:VanZ family protein